MALESQLVAEFKDQLKRSREADHEAWTFSRKLVGRSSLAVTLATLVETVRTSSLAHPLREALVGILQDSALDLDRERPENALKQLTGLPPTKAIRALCVHFGLAVPIMPNGPISSLSQTAIEQFLREQSNPFDLLLHADIASVLDVGAGDLSFADELVSQYLPDLHRQDKSLTLHCIDRLQSGSPLGGPLQADPRLVEKLQNHAHGLQFGFWANQDMFKLGHVKGVLPRYTIAICCAPATPTFAYEPARLSTSLIQRHLRETKGEFRQTRLEGEAALEVLHQGRTLLFPPWKFEVRGPLALLDLLSRRGKVCILASMDSQVFWETLSQLLADVRLRPPNTIFDRSSIAELFGPLYVKLTGLPIGDSLVLSDITDLRPSIPRVLSPDEKNASYRFRYVEVRRGAVLEGIPSGKTARLFQTMTDEDPPWFMILMPDE